MSNENEPKEPKPVTMSDVLDAIKELTKCVTDVAGDFKKLEKEWEKWRKAGKFALSFMLTAALVSAMVI
jgi:hypothetical protein